MESWVSGYRWRDKVRHTSSVNLSSPEVRPCPPTVPAAQSLTPSKETRILFNSYVGAVFVGGGYKAVRDWIGALVDPQAQPGAQSGLSPEPENKRVKVEPMGMGMGFGQPQASYWGQPPPSSMYGQPPPPPPPASAPPPLPMFNPLAPAQPHSAFLPLFNQTAQQRRLEVQYPAQFSGPAHAGRWTVLCLGTLFAARRRVLNTNHLPLAVNGIEKGQGTGASKQLAKEEAARQAYHAMGWAPRE